MGFFLKQLSVPRVRQKTQPARYDRDRDELLVIEGGRWISGIDSKEPPRTKKADLEKSDDQKDRWA